MDGFGAVESHKQLLLEDGFAKFSGSLTGIAVAAASTDAAAGSVYVCGQRDDGLAWSVLRFSLSDVKAAGDGTLVATASFPMDWMDPSVAYRCTLTCTPSRIELATWAAEANGAL